LSRIEALILDFDGLILDTETPAFETWRSIYQRFGADLLLAEWAVCVGRGMVFDFHAHLEKVIGRPLDREGLRQDRLASARVLIESQPLLPGVRKLFDDARDSGLKLAVASSSPRDWVEGHLRRLRLIDQLHSIKCKEDVSHTKPDPELFLKSLDSLGAAAANAIAFEDSPNGVLAANRAGIFCVVVTNPITDQLSFDGAKVNLRADSLAEIDLRDLVRRVERNG
jgi:HAD superfamily hydrolase (TIGR01509 family)